VLKLTSGQNTRSNSKVAVELESDIVDLAKSIDDIVRQLKDRFDPIAQSLSNEQRTRLSSKQVNKSGIFKIAIDKLYECVQLINAWSPFC
jgi:predicted  nucleic acid-binding Zn-ribbon protein